MNVDAIYVLMVALFGGGCLFVIYLRHHRQVLVSREQIFSDCRHLMDIQSSTMDEQGYSSVLADWKGSRVKLSVEVDNLTARKVPVMWMHLTLYRMQKDSTGATLDILARPQNTESFSPSWLWTEFVKPLSGWPEHARYMTKNQPPSLFKLDRDVKQLFANAHCKELLITPVAVRLTWLVKQSDRGHYLLLRAIDFDDKPIESTLVQGLLKQLDSLIYHLDEVQYEAA